jgi:hypothetical protein
MNPLAHHQVGQGDTRGLHSHPYFTRLRLRAVFFKPLERIWPTVVGDDDARLFHGLLPTCQALDFCGVNYSRRRGDKYRSGLTSGHGFDTKSESMAISVGDTDLSTRDLPRKADQRGGVFFSRNAA